MNAVRLPRLDPEFAYLTSSLFLPKRHIEEGPVRSALTFGFIDDERELVEEHPDHLEVPRSFLSEKQLEELEIQVVDLRPTEFKKIDLRPKYYFKLRPEQVPAWDALKDANDGVLVLGCGKGKTLLAWLKAAHEGGPVLFVSWQKAHLGNAQMELEKWFDFGGEIGWIAGEKMEHDRDIVFCTVQTLAGRVEQGRLPPSFFSRFALIIFDECHHLSAEWFSKSVDACLGKRLGLTATEKRVDRLEGIFLNHLGPVFYKDISQDLKPTFYVVETGIETPDNDSVLNDKNGERNIGKIRTWLGLNPDRNDTVRMILDDALRRGRVPYIASHSVDQTELLHGDYPGSGCITGKVKKHEERLRQLRNFTPVFVTMGVGGESYNREDLDTLLLATPFAARDYASPAFQQVVGRIQRKIKGKDNAEVYLFSDEVPESKGLTYTLVKEARRQGFEVKAWKPRKRSGRKLRGS